MKNYKSDLAGTKIPFQVGSYTVATLPTLTIKQRGAQVVCTDWETTPTLMEWTGYAWQPQRNKPSEMVAGITSSFLSAASGSTTFAFGSPVNGDLVAMTDDSENATGGLWIYNEFGAWTRASGWEVGTVKTVGLLICIATATELGIYRLGARAGAPLTTADTVRVGDTSSYITFDAISTAIPLTGGGGGTGLTHGEVMSRASLGF